MRKFHLASFVEYTKEIFGNSLETSTIKRYLQSHSITHIPVDLDTDEATEKYFRNEVRGLITDIVGLNCPECYDLFLEQQNNAARLGFPYLNTDESCSLFARMRILEEQVLKKFNNGEYLEIYSKWIDLWTDGTMKC